MRGDCRDERLVTDLLRKADIIIPLAALVRAPLCATETVSGGHGELRSRATALQTVLSGSRSFSCDQQRAWHQATWGALHRRLAASSHQSLWRNEGEGGTSRPGPWQCDYAAPGDGVRRVPGCAWTCWSTISSGGRCMIERWWCFEPLQTQLHPYPGCHSPCHRPLRR